MQGLISALGLTIAIFAHTTAHAADSCVHDARTFRCVEYLYNYDGDTVSFSIPNVHPLLGDKISVRIRGLDTPERYSQDPCEAELAEIARGFVQRFMQQARKIELRQVDRGKYFRILADIYVQNQSLKNRLIERKLGVPYDGGKKSHPNWCQMLQEADAIADD